MDKWLQDELKKLGVFEMVPMAPQPISQVRARHEEEGSIELDISEVNTWLEHDAQCVEALSQIVDMNYTKFKMSVELRSKYPALYNYIDGMFQMAQIIVHRNTTHGIGLAGRVQSHSDTD